MQNLKKPFCAKNEKILLMSQKQMLNTVKESETFLFIPLPFMCELRRHMTSIPTTFLPHLHSRTLAPNLTKVYVSRHDKKVLKASRSHTHILYIVGVQNISLKWVEAKLLNWLNFCKYLIFKISTCPKMVFQKSYWELNLNTWLIKKEKSSRLYSFGTGFNPLGP